MSAGTRTRRAPRPGAVLPHRDRWLLLDDLLEVTPQSVVAQVRAFSAGELAGHFPGMPVVPGSLLIEAMAQTAGVLAGDGVGSARPRGVGYLAAVERAVFLRPLRPGVSTRAMAEQVARDQRLVTATCEVADGRLGVLCRARLRIALPDESGHR